MITALAPGWPLWLDPDSPEGRRYFVERFNARNTIGQLSLKDGREGITVVSLDAARTARADAQWKARIDRIDRALARIDRALAERDNNDAG
jgi:hypothetical protein